MKRNWVVQRRIVALCEGYLIVCLFRLFRIVPSNMVIVLGEQFVFELKHRIDNLLVKLERLLGITQDFLWDIYTSDELLITRDSCGLNKFGILMLGKLHLSLCLRLLMLFTDFLFFFVMCLIAMVESILLHNSKHLLWYRQYWYILVFLMW